MRTAGRLGILAAVFVFGLSGPARAQDTHKAGVVIGFPSAIGVLWHATPKVAIRPEFSVSGSSNDLTGTTTNTHVTNWALGFGLSALFYVHTDDRLRTYIVPRFAYAHSASSASGSSTVGVPLSASSNTYGGSGSFGAQYGLGDRFALFGEVGLEISHRAASTVTSTSNLGWATRGGVGVVFYP
jgi:hypothetical protein